MKKYITILILLFLCSQSSKAQDSLYVKDYLKGNYKIYPYKYFPNNLSYRFENFQKSYSTFAYIENETGKIEKNPNYKYDSTQYRNIFFYDSLFFLDELNFRMEENIPPFLDSVLDGKYEMIYAPIPYKIGDTLKFLKNRIAIIFEVKNNLMNGSSYWFAPIKQRLYKKGNYQNGKKEGVWWMENQKVIAKNTKISFLQSYITECSYSENIKNGIEKNITCPISYNSNYNTTIIWNWKNDTLQHYKQYFDSILLIEGKFQQKEDEWTFWDWKIKPTESEFQANNSNKYLLEHYLTNNYQKQGRGTIIRSLFKISKLPYDSTYLDYGIFGESENPLYNIDSNFDYEFYFNTNECGALNNFYKMYIPLEEEQNFISLTTYNGNVLNDNYEEINYDYWSYTNQYIEESKTCNEILNSDGYLFAYSSYERYYPNGQLFFKFKLDEQGNLPIENDTVYFESGKPMNIVRFDSTKREYEQIIYDEIGTIVKHKLYFEDGSLKIDSLNLDTIASIIKLNDLTYNLINWPNYEYNIFSNYTKDESIILINQLFQTKKINKTVIKDTNLLVSSFYNAETSYLINYYFNPKTLNGKINYSDNHFLTFRYLKDSIHISEIFKKDSFEIASINKLKINQINTNAIQYYLNFNSLELLVRKDRSCELNLRIRNKNNQLIPFSGIVKIALDNKAQLNYSSDTFSINLKNREEFKAFNLPDFFDFNTHKLLLNCKNGKVKKIEIVTKSSDELIYDKTLLNNTVIIEKWYVNKKIIKKAESKNGYLNGIQFTLSESGDTLFFANYINKKLDGKYINRTNYQTSIFNYKNDEFIGKQCTLSETGDTLLFANYINNKLEGKYIYRLNNQTSECTYKNGELNGELKTFDSSKKLIKIQNYLHNKQEGLSIYYESQFTKYENWSKNETSCRVEIKDTLNNFIESYSLENEKLSGIYIKYYPNGSIYKKAKFLNNEIIDTVIVYNSDQSLQKIIFVDKKNNTIHIQNFENNIKMNELELLQKNSYVVKNVLFDLFVENTNPYFSKYYPRTDMVSYFFAKYLEFEDSKIKLNGNFYINIFKNEKLKIGTWKYFSKEDTYYTQTFLINEENLRYYFSDPTYYYYYTNEKQTIKVSIENGKDSIEYNTKEIITQFDKNDQKTIEKYVIDNQPLYNCGQQETYEIKTYYVAYEKDSSMHLRKGWIKNYYESGVIQSQGENKNGLPTGIWKYYNDNGSLREIGRYENGKREGRWLAGDLSKVAYLGDICLDLDKPENVAYQKLLENQLKIEEVYFKNGVEIQRNISTIFK